MMATALPALFTTSATALPAGATAAAIPAAGLGATSVGAAITPVAAATTAAGGFGLLDALSTGLFIASGIGQIGSGIAEQKLLSGQSKMEEFNAQQEVLRGREESLRILQELNQNLAAQTVGAFASGLAPTGSVEAGKKQAIQSAQFETGIARDEAEMRAGARRQQAAVQKRRGQAALVGGLFDAAGTFGEGAIRVARR